MMNGARAATVLRYLRRLGGAQAARAAADADLLERFVACREETAFIEIVRRHGPMVLGVCQRLLPNPHDAEDAFQATFLVLAAKPHAVGQPAALANWLFGVARRTALRLHVDSARRSRHERRAARSEALAPESLWFDVRPLLDAEVARLPGRCREVFVLCCLEGRTHEEAARLLGCAAGTVASRLSRARERLRGRLARRGLTLTVAAAFLAAGEAEAAVSPELLAAVVKAAAPSSIVALSAAGSISPRVAALTQGVLRAMWIAKLKVASALVLAASIVSFGAGLVLSPAAPPTKETAVTPPKPPAPDVAANDGGKKEVTAPAAPPKPPAEDDRKAKDDEKLPSQPPATASAQDLQDEIELLEARLEVKRAELEAAKLTSDRAKADVDRADKLMANKAIAREEYDSLRSALVAAEAQVRIKQAEIVEPTVRLKQARRRLEALSKPAVPMKESDRVDELEKKLDRLQKDLEALKRRVPPQ
jgi:RNA polymerase sigma factor (sigma-70 family)